MLIVNWSLIFQRRVLRTRAPRALTFSVKVASVPGRTGCPVIWTPTSMGIRVSRREAVNDFGAPIPSAIYAPPFSFLEQGRYRTQPKPLAAAGLHAIERLIRGVQDSFNGRSVGWIDRKPDADRDFWLLAVVGQEIADAGSGELCFLLA